MLFRSDVVVDGVSYVRNYHDDTDAELAQNGLDATIARLQRVDAGTVERASPSTPKRAR